MDDQIKWLWRMTPAESFFESYTTSYRVTLGTHKPLLEEHLILALKHLFRKVPSLRTCFGERDGEKWLREMSQEIIDFEVVSDTTDELFTRLQEHAFNKTTGPLWCIKFKPSEKENSLEFSYFYELFLGVSHAITDGTSNVKICGFLVQLLDDVISGRPVDDTKQLGIFVSQKRTQTLIQEQVTWLEDNPELHASLQKEYAALQSRKSLFKSTFRDIGEVEGKSVMLTRDLDSDTSFSFIKRCRAEGVTVHSAFTGLANMAMVDLLEEGGLKLPTYGIRSDHALDGRRYWKEDTSEYLGMLTLPFLSIYTETPVNASQEMWNYIRLVNEDFQGKLKAGRPLQEEASKLTTNSKFSFESDFGVSNMGDVTKLLIGGAQNVRILHLLRSSKIHDVPCCFCFYIHTLSGRLTVTLVYNSSLVSPVLAKQFFEVVLKKML